MDTFVLTARATRDAGRVVVVSQDGDVVVWQIRPRRQIARFQIPGIHPLYEAPDQVAFDPSGELFAVAGNDGRIHVWRLEPFELLLTDIPTPPGTVRRLPTGGLMQYGGLQVASAVALSPDARTLAVGIGNLIVFWDLRSGERRDSLWLPDVERRFVDKLAFSPGDGALLIGTGDSWLYGTNVARKEFAWKVDLGLGHFQLFHLDPTGSHLAVAGLDSTVRIINAATRSEVCRWAVPFVQTAAFSPNGDAIVLGNGRNSVDIFHARDCRRLAQYREFAGSVTGVWFAPRCSSIIAALNVSPVLYERSTDRTVAEC